MNCSSCKRPNADGLDFCDYCGTPLGASGGGKRKTEMEGVTTPKHKTEMERAAPNPLDPFAPPPGSGKPAGGGGGGGAVKARTVFDSPGDAKDPFAPQTAAAQAPKRDDARYAGRRITGFLITFDRAPDGRFFVLREGRNVIGRGGDCDLVVDDDENVSTTHAIVLCRNGRTVIDDEKSMNGTYLNGEDVMEKTDVKDGDVVRLGKTTNLLCRLIDPASIPSALKPGRSVRASFALLVLAGLGALGALAAPALAQPSQERGLHIATVSSPSPGGIQVLVTADAKADKAIGSAPSAKDFTVWLGGAALLRGLTVARNGSRGKPLTTIVLLDESASYKDGHGKKVALPAIFDYGKDAGTDELALIVFALDTKAFGVHVGPTDFMKDLEAVGARHAGQATSVTIGLAEAIKLAAQEGEPGLREVVLFTDAGDEAEVDKAVWATVIAQAHELGVRVSVVLPTDDKLPAGAKHENWVTTTTNLNRLATETSGVFMTSWDPATISAKLREARTALKASLVLEGKLCGAKSGQPVDVRVEYVPGAKREAWSAGAQLAAAAWAPGSDAPCPSLCTTACSAWEECIAGTCAARTCTSDGACPGGAVCLGGQCGKACSPSCANWQECKSGACGARACAGDESCGGGSKCDKGFCTTPAMKSSSKLIWILAGAGALLLLAALFVLFRKKPAPPPVIESPAPAPAPVEPQPEKPIASAGVDLDPLPETHLVAIGGWTTPGERWRLHKRKTVAGGSTDPSDGVDLQFGIKQVSSRHAQFELFPSGDLWVTDLGSSNGTFVNGKKLVAKERAKLVPGDQVKLSQNLILVVERPGASASATDDEPAPASASSPASEPEPGVAKPKAATKFDPGGR